MNIKKSKMNKILALLLRLKDIADNITALDAQTKQNLLVFAWILVLNRFTDSSDGNFNTCVDSFLLLCFCGTSNWCKGEIFVTTGVVVLGVFLAVFPFKQFLKSVQQLNCKFRFHNTF